MLTLSLHHQGKLHPTTMHLPATTDLATLRTAVLTHLSLPSHTSLRLLCRGKALTSPLPLSTLPSPSTLYVLSTSPSTISSVRSSKPDPLVLPFSRPTPKYIASPLRTRPIATISQSYGFARIEALPGFPDTAHATAILEQLAADPGFLDVMRRKGWRVGALKEMPPEGQVGVDPVCVLGYNTGKGMEIHLRLRTDDRMGFRPMRMIREVLAHELAHNEFSEHDNRFKELMRWIEREAAKKDWRSGGETLAGGRQSVRVEGVDPLQEVHRSAATRLSFSGKLGTKEGVGSGVEMRGSACGSEKADEQMTEAEQELDERTTASPGAHRNPGDENRFVRASSTSPEDEQMRPAGMSKTETSIKATSSSPDTSLPAASQPSSANPQNAFPGEQVPPLSNVKPATSALDQLTGLGFSRGLAALALRENGLDATRAANWLFSLSAASSEDTSAADGEHSEAIAQAEDALRRLCASGLPAESLRSALDALHLYLSNVLRNPGADRFARINATNAGFQRRVGAHGEATAVLQAAGFRLDSGVWRYEGRDPGRLWVTKSVVQDRLVKELTR